MTYNECFAYVLDIVNNASKSTPTVIAIDGRSASGKTTFANEISRSTGVSVIHTDDFCRPRDKNGNLDISEFDGNFDISRFYNEVVLGIKSGLDFEIGIFNCQKGCVTEKQKLKSSSCYIIEGAFSHNPNLGDYANVKLFFDIDKDVQKERILKRNGAVMLEKYMSVWIPAEERYIKHYGIKEKSDYIINN